MCANGEVILLVVWRRCANVLCAAAAHVHARRARREGGTGALGGIHDENRIFEEFEANVDTLYRYRYPR